MKKIFLLFSLVLLPPGLNRADDLSFPDDLPGPKELMDTFFAPMEPFSFGLTRYFTITRRGRDCRHYQLASEGVEFTVCIQNRQENDHWIQRVIYFFPNNRPINLVIEHTATKAIPHEDLWNWRFPVPSGKYYSFSIPDFGLSTRYEKSSSEISFKMIYGEDFSFLETKGSSEKMTRLYSGSLFDKFSECQATVILYNGIPRTYFQIDHSSDIAPYLFRQQCLSELNQKFSQAGEYLLGQFKTHVTVD